MNIILIAEESAGIQTLNFLARSKHQIKGVLSSKSATLGTSVSRVARNLGIPVFDAKLAKNPEFSTWVVKQKIDLLVNVNSLYVIHPEILKVLRIGAFNLHAGPLPEYSGLNAPNWAIYNREEMHAVTLHWISSGINTGDIAYEKAFPIDKTDTSLSLTAKCIQRGLPLIHQLLEDAEKDSSSIPHKEQNLEKRVYYRRSEIPGNGYIEWSQPARDIDAFVRACDYYPFKSEWGHPRTKAGTYEVSIVKTSVSQNLCITEPGTVCYFNEKAAVATGDSWLYINKCFLDGRYLPADKILKNGQKLGSRQKVYM